MGRDAPVVHATLAEQPPEIDGVVDASVWSAAVPATGFIQQQPVENAPSSETTVVRVLFDDRNLYIAVVCFDSEPERIVVTQSRRDGDLTHSDSLQIILDTFNDDQNAFLFGTNPLGVEYDGQVASEGSAGGALSGVGAGFGGGGGSQRGQLAGFNRNWDGDWTVAARITDEGWEAELAIPFAAGEANEQRFEGTRTTDEGVSVGVDVKWGVTPEPDRRLHRQRRSPWGDRSS